MDPMAILCLILESVMLSALKGFFAFEYIILVLISFFSPFWISPHLHCFALLCIALPVHYQVKASIH
jgi:predicted benzoate:H+ symporter BenE